MAKKALCVGINDYPYAGNDLNGCVNDAKAWAKLLIDHYDFAPSDVKLLLDSEATKANIVLGLTDLLAGALAGDVLVFTNSSHGTYVADEDSDEEQYDEALCPYDCADHLLIDDELRVIFSGLPKGVHLTVISDSCFSGTVTRAVIETPAGQKPPDQRRVRFLSPKVRNEPVLDNPWTALNKTTVKYPASKMKEVLLSGCTDQEYSYDALIDGVYHGAMTYCALKAIEEANYQITYRDLIKRLKALIKKAGYPQHPQLEGRAANKKLPLFT